MPIEREIKVIMGPKDENTAPSESKQRATSCSPSEAFFPEIPNYLLRGMSPWPLPLQ